MAFSGLARGNALVQTAAFADGTATRGTNNNNCGNGYTPWGTTHPEENFTNVIARAVGDNACAAPRGSRLASTAT